MKKGRFRKNYDRLSMVNQRIQVSFTNTHKEHDPDTTIFFFWHSGFKGLKNKPWQNQIMKNLTTKIYGIGGGEEVELMNCRLLFYTVSIWRLRFRRIQFFPYLSKCGHNHGMMILCIQRQKTRQQLLQILRFRYLFLLDHFHHWHPEIFKRVC